MTMNDIEKQVLGRIIPSANYRKVLKELIDDVQEILQKEILKRNIPAEIELVGSTAKDTFLKHNMDVDFFLVFPTTYSKDYIAQNAISIGKTFLNDVEESYAEHPYLRGQYKGHKIEVVPCYKIEDASQKLSAVDRTPLHTRYVKKNLTPEQKNEVRLLKQFLQGIGCYGAEAEVEGFSGYLCEILIIKYGSFSKLIDDVENWKSGHKLAICKGDSPRFKTSLVFIDPVDENRNVSSALSKEKFGLFVNACKEFKKEPRITFFFPNKTKLWELDKIKKEIQKQSYSYIGIEFAKPSIISENLYPQVKKAAKAVKEASERYGFTIYDVAFNINDGENKILLIVKTQKEPLSKTVLHMGPPIEVKKNSQEFLHKWKGHSKVVKGPYEENGRFYVEIEREYIEISDFLNSQIKKLSLGRHLDKIVCRKFKILNLEGLLIKSLRCFWTEYLDGKTSWER